MAREESRKHRFFVESLDGGRVALSAGEAHHAAHVLRLRAGAAVELFDGRGGRAHGRIADCRRGSVVVVVRRREAPAARPAPQIHLAFAAPKGKRLDWLLEKATELGAASLRPTIFERSIPAAESFSQARRDRWLGHCIAAAKQSGLDFLPELHPPGALEGLLPDAAGMFGLLGDVTDAARPLRNALSGADTSRRGPILILVGPEGGLTDGERALAVAGGFRPVRLGGTTLRTETAAVALLAAVTALCEPQQ